MRRCSICKKEEGSSHLRQCSYYLPMTLVGDGFTGVDSDSCLVEDTEGCPYSLVTATEECDGCMECEIEA